MRTILVVGNWSSGTTAVTGYLSQLGGYTCRPTIKTSDPRTPDSHESVEFRHAVAAIYDELSLERIGDPKEFSTWFAPWLTQQHRRATLNGRDFVALKHPLSAFLIAEIYDICRPLVVLVKRPYDEIENTRLRRQWAPNYGKSGAEAIYPKALSTFAEEEIPFLSINFNDFRKSQEARDGLVNFCGITATTRQTSSAEAWIR